MEKIDRKFYLKLDVSEKDILAIKKRASASRWAKVRSFC